MQFQILKLVLWPRKGGEPQVVHFKPGKVNVISGDSKTGKSAVIPIIDYCLCADECAIPVGVIREQCSWFGVVVATENGQSLFARREPGDQKNTGDMFLIEGLDIEVPATIEKANTNMTAVKAQLDRLAALPQTSMEPGQERNFKSRPSFRDMAAFNFQPQNIVANPGVLFFKGDTTEHREKLRSVLPFFLGALGARVLAIKQRLDELESDLRRKDLAIRRERRADEEWLRDGQEWYLKASELGIAPPGPMPNNVEELVRGLRTVLEQATHSPASEEQTDEFLGSMEHLRDQERDWAREAMVHRQRLDEFKRLQSSSSAFGDGLRLQRDRLEISTWLRDRFNEGSPDALHLVEHSAETLDTLCNALQEVEANSASFPLFSDAVQAEMMQESRSLELATGHQRDIRRQLSEFEAKSQEAANHAASLRATDRFVGRLEEALRSFDRVKDGSQLEEEAAALRDQVQELRAAVHQNNTEARMLAALNKIQSFTDQIVPRLDAEWKEDSIRLDPKELTVVVLRENRKDYLWEIGSGANWLAYHVAMTLALQKFFLSFKRHPVPALLIYDQPSQVYFPKSEDMMSALKQGGSRDIRAVRDVFEVLGEAVIAQQGKLQIIVLDHAYSDVWGNLPGVELVEEWRDGRKLVPQEWITD